MLRIEGLNTHYGASHVLQGVDLDMPQGRISAVLGRNGVGKTTMVKTIMGLVVQSGGRVHVSAVVVDGQGEPSRNSSGEPGGGEVEGVVVPPVQAPPVRG